MSKNSKGDSPDGEGRSSRQTNQQALAGVERSHTSWRVTRDCNLNSFQRREEKARKELPNGAPMMLHKQRGRSMGSCQRESETDEAVGCYQKWRK